MKRCSKRILAAVMCAAVLTVSAPITAYADSTLDHLNGQYSELEKQQQALKDKLNQTKTEKEKQEAIRNNLNNQITNTQKRSLFWITRSIICRMISPIKRSASMN